jgi:D-alanine transaminase
VTDDGGHVAEEGVRVSEIVYFNGTYVPYEQALVSVEDRGMLFADGIYEVVRAYGGRFFRLDGHLERLVASAAEIRLPLPPLDDVRAAMDGVLARSGLGDASVYVEITRGHPGPRAHALPAETRPTCFAVARPVPAPAPLHVERGAAGITVPDRRWHMCHVKSVGLLLNSLAKQAALDVGAQEALFIRDGVLTEGSATNAFAVIAGTLWTHPDGPHILSGITRQVVLELAERLGIPVRLEAVPLAALYGADEVFVSGTNSELLPIVSLDGRTVGQGTPGPVTRRLAQAFRSAVGG